MITTASLFCGAGGESAGRELAFEQLGIDTRRFNGLALNHWDLAVGVHGRNFPHVRVVQEDITAVTAGDFGLKHIDLLWASPSCVHHSRARGGKPREEQQRSHAWEVVDRWLKVADVSVFLMENVPEFLEWGPLDDDNQPIKARKGEYFRAFVQQLRDLGYEVDWRVLCAADYGDPTTRRRLFLQAVNDGRGIHWPEQTHRDPNASTFVKEGAGYRSIVNLPTWRSAAECIDWSLPVQSIFDRKKPLAEATLKRIAAGVNRFVLNGTPYIINMRGTADNQVNASACAITEPLKTISSGGIHAALIAPFLTAYHSERHAGEVRGSQLDLPIPTLDTSNRYGLVAANIIGIDNKSASNGAYSINSPLGTQTTKARHCLVASFLTQYYGNGDAQGLDSPLRTVRTHDCHSLVLVEIDGATYAITDIGMRMLEPHELAAAMGFPVDYNWNTAGGVLLTKRDRVKMIGNACPVNTVSELIKAVVMARGKAFGMAGVAA